MKKIYFSFLPATLWILSFSFLNAQWPTTVDDALFVDYGIYPYLIVDPNDESVIVVYLNDNQMRAKKYDRYGYPEWGGNTVILMDTVGGYWVRNMSGPEGQWGAVISDDSGGVVVCWEDYRHADLDPYYHRPIGNELYIQRVDASGQILYGNNGMRISGVGINSFHPLGDIKTDYHDGFIVGYYGDTTIYCGALKRFNRNGQILWERYFDEGFNLDINTTDLFGNIFISYGGAYGQPNRRMKTDLSGGLLWPDTLNGKIPDSELYRGGGAFSDGMGGAIGVGKQYLKINRVDSTGQFVFGENGIDLGGGQFVMINYAPDSEGGIYVGWDKDGVRLQRITTNGSIVFDTTGIVVSDSLEGGGRFINDDSGGLIIIWPKEEQNGIRPFYSKRIDSSGNFIWDSSGILFYNMSNEILTNTVKMMNEDGRGGAIYLWTELNAGNRVMIKQISKYGQLGHVISTIRKEKSIKKQQLNIFKAIYPNPFNNEVKIVFEINSKSSVDIRIYDILGKEIKNLLKKDLNSGEYKINWDGKNNYGEYVSSGIYLFYLMIDQKLSYIKKSILLR